jgi:hypothetical protein
MDTLDWGSFRRLAGQPLVFGWLAAFCLREGFMIQRHVWGGARRALRNMLTGLMTGAVTLTAGAACQPPTPSGCPCTGDPKGGTVTIAEMPRDAASAPPDTSPPPTSPLPTKQPEDPPAKKTLTLEGAPPIPDTLRARINQYLNARKARVASISDDGKQILIRIQLHNTNQVHAIRQPMGARTQLTFEEQPIGTPVEFVPGRTDALTYLRDADGTEERQLFRLDHRRQVGPRRVSGAKGKVDHFVWASRCGEARGLQQQRPQRQGRGHLREQTASNRRQRAPRRRGAAATSHPSTGLPTDKSPCS